MSAEVNDTFINELTTFFKRRNEGLSFIAQEVLTGSVTSITFSSIPNYFRHLFLECQLRTDAAAELDNALLRFNADSAGNYDRQLVQANDATLTSAAAIAQTSISMIGTEAANSRASNFAPGLVFIPFYKETNAEKWLIAFSGIAGNASAVGDVYALYRIGRWRSTVAITSLTLLPVTGTNFVTGSKVNLYGIG